MIVDDFFDNPDYMRQLALEQEYFPDPDGSFPGQRSEMLMITYPSVYRTFILKYLSLFFDMQKEHIEWSFFNIYFHKIQSRFESGWVHRDVVGTPSMTAGVVYLNPHVVDPYNSGTSLYRQITPVEDPSHMYEYYKGNISHEEFAAARDLNNSCFEETLKISNKYNRLIAYNGHVPHKPNDFSSFKEEDRYTLVFFMDFKNRISLPIDRSRAYFL